MSRSHEDYLQFVKEHLRSQSTKFLQDFFAEHIFWITAIDLSSTAQLMKHRYSANPRGRKPRDPADMLRSLLLMHKAKVTNINEWVRQLRTLPVYAILSGFDPDDTPGIGTFYDFLARLWCAPSAHLSKRKKRKLKKPRKRGKKNQKMQPKNPSIVDKLVRRAKRRKSIHYAPKSHDLLQELFQHHFVHVSADKGLLGNIQSLSILADGSPVKTGARAYGKILCECRKTGNWSCDCDRQFSDPDANYGWDSSREQYYFGRSLYMISAAESPYDLPLYPRLFRASKHDAVLFVSTFHEFLHWYTQFKVGESILDSAHDAFPIYELLEQHDVSSIIDLNQRRSNKFIYNDMEINPEGIPVCPIGRNMINWGRDKKRHRHKWRCPAKVGGWECPTPCSDSDYGRTFHTSTADNPRLFPRVKRDSKQWYKRYALRTGVERCIKRQKIDYKLESSRGRSSRHWNIRTYLIAMCQHADAWLAEAAKGTLPTVEQWMQGAVAA